MAKPTSVRLDDEAEKYLNELAAEKDTTMTILINEAVKFYYRHEGEGIQDKVYPYLSAQHMAALAVVQASLYDGFFPRMPDGKRAKNLTQVGKGPLPVYMLSMEETEEDETQVEYFPDFGQAMMALMWAWHVHPDQPNFAEEGRNLETEILPEILQELLEKDDFLNEDEKARIRSFLHALAPEDLDTLLAERE